MTDQEMFELAAKAAEIVGYTWSDEYRCMVKLAVLRADGEFSEAVYTWNPRDDDGDTFRLAVKLKMQVAPGVVLAPGLNIIIDDSEDQCAATRLAVFRAAVEIGKAMP